MSAGQFDSRARTRMRRTRSPRAPIATLVCLLPVRRLRSVVIRSICRIEGGQMWSAMFRELMLSYHRVHIGTHSYGPGLRPGRVPPGTRIGNYCSFASGVEFLRRNHPIDRLSQHPFFFNHRTGLLDRDTIGTVADNPVSIGHDVWIGDGAVIAPGCKHIGDGAIVAARSVVTADVPPLAIVGGTPARLIRWRFDDAERAAWLASQWWLASVDALPCGVEAFLAPFTLDGCRQSKRP